MHSELKININCNSPTSDTENINETEIVNIMDSNILNYRINLSNHKIIVFLSGGKDSSVLLHLLINNYITNLNNVYALLIKFPKKRYINNIEVKNIKKYWNEFGLDVDFIEIKKEKNMENISNPCKYCEDIMSFHFINWIQNNDIKKSLIFLATHLWDVTAYILELSYFKFIGKSKFSNKNNYFRKMLSKRCYPIFNLKDLSDSIIIRPLVNINPESIIEYMHLNKIKILTKKCEYQNKLPKRILFEFFNVIEINSINYNNIITFANKNKLLLKPIDYDNIPLRYKIF